MQKLAGVNRTGISKSIAVMPGDEISIGAYVHYMNLSSTGNPTIFLNSLVAAFGGISGAPGEAGKIFSGLDNYAAG